jgi:hypothetical protein
VGIAQLAIQYCNVAVNTPALQTKLFGSPLSPSQFTSQAGIDSVTGAIANKVMGSSAHQPNASTITTELSSLIGKLCMTNSCTTAQGTNAVAAAACATAFGSADMLIN